MKVLYTISLIFLLLLFTRSTAQHLDRKGIESPGRLVSDYGNVRIGGLVPVHIRESNDTLCKIHDPQYSYILNRDGNVKCCKLNIAGVLWSETIRFTVLAANQYLFNGR